MSSSISKNGSIASGHDAIALLRNDHDLIRELFTLFEQAPDRRQMKVVARLICKLLSVHMTIEEELVYPLAQRLLNTDAAVYEAEVEHTVAKVLIAELESLRIAEEPFAATVRVLSEYIRHHFREEETNMFRQLSVVKPDMKVLGNKLAARRMDLLALAGIAECELSLATAYGPNQDPGQQANHRLRHRRPLRGKQNSRSVSLRTLVARLVAQRERSP